MIKKRAEEVKLNDSWEYVADGVRCTFFAQMQIAVEYELDTNE